jgi:ABC-type Zn uptake system ZnuABC Zn-binding protein ZnuA
LSFRRVVFLFSLLLAACSPAPVPAELSVLASTEIIGDVAAVIARGHVRIRVIIPQGTDPHAFEPSPQDAALLEQADLIFVNGLNLEEPLVPLLESAGSRMVSVSEGIVTLEREEHDQEEGGADPHVWTNPLNVKIWADNIAEALSELDPDHAADYAANAAAYKAELDELDGWAQDQIGQIPSEERVLVTDHEALAYFADRYGFEIVGALIPGFSTVSEPSAGELADLEGTIGEFDVKAIFVGVSLNPSFAEQVAADTGIQLVPLYTESLGGLAPTYLDLIRYDVNAIVEALK